MNFNRKNHWENIYGQKKPVEVSWYQVEPVVSLKLIALTGMDYTAKIIDVERYSPEKLKNVLGDFFKLVDSISETHITPWNNQQRFIYCYFKKFLK